MEPISLLREFTCQWDHTVIPATRQRRPPRHNPSWRWYSIHPPVKDERLSWPESRAMTYRNMGAVNLKYRATLTCLFIESQQVSMKINTAVPYGGLGKWVPHGPCSRSSLEECASSWLQLTNNIFMEHQEIHKHHAETLFIIAKHQQESDKCANKLA